MKKIISIIIAAMMICSVSAVMAHAAETDEISVGADSNTSAGAESSGSASGAGNTVKFDASKWKGYSMIYCHIWERGGDSFYNWQSKKELCAKESDSIFVYDLDKANISLDSSKDYCIIFSSNTGVQTYDTTFGKECFGDMLKVTDNKLENPKDSEKRSEEAVWTTNSSKYGPHLALTSIGSIVGSKLCPHEKGTEVIGDWIPNYYTSQFLDPVKALATALPKFGITSSADLDTIYGYIISKKPELTDNEKKDIYNVLAEGFKKAFPAKAGEVKSADEATKSAEKKAKEIKANGGHVVSDSSASSGGSSSGTGTGSGSSASSGAGTSSGSGSYNSSGSGPDGQEDTILFVLAGVMLVCAGAIYMTRRKREE
jgi:LPXTG-motif cell wall-anchored protein